MSKPRLLYQDWIIEKTADPRLEELYDCLTDENGGYNPAIIEAVRTALEKLTEEEREFIICYYFRGLNLVETASELNRKSTRMDGLHLQAVKKLKKHLAGFVEAEFGIKTEGTKPCPVCISRYRREIEKIIASKAPSVPWSAVLAELKRKFGIIIRAPQVLISHRKYHV